MEAILTIKNSQATVAISEKEAHCNIWHFYQSFPIWYTLRAKLVWNSLKNICHRRHICLLFYVTQPPRLFTMRNLGGFFMPAARMLNA